jgi:hypothetical protein
VLFYGDIAHQRKTMYDSTHRYGGTMNGVALLVKDLQITVSINDDCNIAMKQCEPVYVTCVMDGAKIVRVHADDGIEFETPGGILSVSYGQCADITSLCDKAALERQMQADKQEREQMEIHTRGA